MLSYFVDTVSTAYETFESRTASDRIHDTQQERVHDYVHHDADSVFRLSDIRASLPGVSEQTIRLAPEATGQGLAITGLREAIFGKTPRRPSSIGRTCSPSGGTACSLLTSRKHPSARTTFSPGETMCLRQDKTKNHRIGENA